MEFCRENIKVLQDDNVNFQLGRLSSLTFGPLNLDIFLPSFCLPPWLKENNMGVTSSKFRQALQRGEEAEAVDLYMRNPNLKKAPKLNRSFGSNHGHNTALHYVTTHGMKDLLRDLLSEGANPFVKNANGQTAFHCVCVAKKYGDDIKRRLECLHLLILWMNGNERAESIRHAIDKVRYINLYVIFTTSFVLTI